LPLRGSFDEVFDLLRECALKNELAELTNVLDSTLKHRPTDDALGRELERAGFEYVDVDLRLRTLRFASSRDFFEDAVARLLVLPEVRADLGLEIEEPLAYVREAIGKYWSGTEFELTVNVGVVSGRRRV
jgi:hypothetical protein